MRAEAGAEALVNAQRARGESAGREWAKEQPATVDRLGIIAEADRRYPDTMADFIASYNLSGGFIDGAQSVFAEAAERA